jgi:GntR family transcriptional regulator
MTSFPITKPTKDDGGRLDGLAVDRHADVPLGVQLAWSLRARIGSGELAPGQRLPGLRELAEAAAINVNTARTVYQRLEAEGLIDSHQGSGTFVARGPRTASAAGVIAAEAARAARNAGIDPREVSAALYVADTRAEKPREQAAERRRALRTQISALERTLGEMEASHPGLAPPPATAAAGNGPTLPSADELEHVRATLVRRLATLQAAIDTPADADDGQKPPPRKTRSRSVAKSAKRTAASRRGPGRPRAAPGTV